MARKKIFKKAKAVSEPDTGDGQNLAKVKRIRARASYRLFAELHDFLESKPVAADILVKLYDVLDDRRSFGSARNAKYAAESLGWVLKDRDSTSEKMRGNFYFGVFFGDVRCLFGHEVRMFNIGKCHYVACDDCRTYILVGANLLSNWRRENKDIWWKNFESKKGYKFIERCPTSET